MTAVIEKVFPAMGTVHTVTVEGAQHLASVEAVRDRIIIMDRLWSVFREDSEITKLNRHAGRKAVPVSADTLCILKESVLLSEETGGAFDITVGSLSGLWRQAAHQDRIPSFRSIRNARNRTGARRIRFSDGQVLLQKEQTVDLGGIAKGYALDCALEQLKEAGVSNAVLNFGGTVGVIGKPVPVGIRNPFDPDGAPVGTLLLTGRCAVTSGSYERFSEIGGRFCHHIIDPRTGYPSDSGLVSVTLIGQNATELDAFATGAFVLGIEKTMPVLEKHGIDAVFVRTNGEVLRTRGLNDLFQLNVNIPA